MTHNYYEFNSHSKLMARWYVTPCSLEYRSQKFGGTSCFHTYCTSLKEVAELIPPPHPSYVTKNVITVLTRALTDPCFQPSKSSHQ
jgi:hypothetical protein